MLKVLITLLLLALPACAQPDLAPPSLKPARAAKSAVPLAPAPCAGQADTDCLLEAVWAAAARLPGEKQSRMRRLMLETLALSADVKLKTAWEKKLGEPVRPAAEPENFAQTQAEAVINDGGFDGFLSRARTGAAPFNIGRPEIMAAGIDLAPDEAARARLVAAMFDLARSKATRGGMGDDFEKGDFGHALAEASMRRCNLADFDRATALTPVPDNLRYALWRGRITGKAAALATRIRAEADASDTRHVRNALEGLAPILALGYCKA
jgi:hypothetical protein